MSEPVAGARGAAIVTGAGQGIGRRIAVRLAAEGHAVALAARSAGALDEAAAEIAAAGGRALAVPTDVTDAAQVDHLAAIAEAELGPVAVVVSAAGIAGPTAPLWEITPEQWEETFAVNVTGTYLLCRAALPAMLQRGAGSVVVIGSVTGKRPLLGRTPYAASKTALIGLVRTLAWDAGPHGVRVNLVSPGPISGDRLDRVIAAQAQALGVEPEVVRDGMLEGTPLRRLTSADEVADAVLYLAGDGARAVTGDDLNVASGWVMS
ncbi:SDR family oxidoreductase [Baekduia soli]|uniref:SDR family oxidoreductase n=1 Tax=Baekduia soli TaxID=496014 RepID=A0A5B8U645_9ACTN|nr:SDR family NAD(P)-dependent oxidoreductase [Baekduia soli]QEC48365.1 SDR family oxidoreductase [Baekduia soli]